MTYKMLIGSEQHAKAFATMTSEFYIHRTLYADSKTYSESALLKASKFLVVLAEPGAGKTCLMQSLARKLGTTIVTANRFVNSNPPIDGENLFIDAYDELAKVDDSGIYKLLGAEKFGHPTTLVISSRSSEWDNAATCALKEALGEPPLVARFAEFDENEQREIFVHHSPGEDYDAFQSEVARFELEALLPNPQFLKLFIEAYIESGRKFTDKGSIFSMALDRLGREDNLAVKKIGKPLSVNQKVDAAARVFAILLLSGADGVTTSEASEDHLYPLLESLGSNAATRKAILATRMFTPGDVVESHRPVHKIITEYAAAHYLVNRVIDPSDTLSIKRCLTVIAPNSAVRYELRGLLGWMATLGNTSIQKAAVELDPYAVLANGDPSQLEETSKRRLIKGLKETEQTDPYFRRGDFGRRFGIAGFFSPEVADEIKLILSEWSNGHLRELVLELLRGSPAIKHLIDELREITLSPQEHERNRLMALNCLLDQGSAYDHLSDMAVLIFEASQTSLKLAARVIENRDATNFDECYLLGYFRVCNHLYRDRKERVEPNNMVHHSVKRLVGSLKISTVESLLNELTNDLVCNCSKGSFECDCRNGTSKIIGVLIDRYFELSIGPHDPVRIWKWVQDLRFHSDKQADQSKSVEVLQTDIVLRQGIIELVFGALTDIDEIFAAKRNRFDGFSHSGLRFVKDDYKFLVDHAYNTDNPELWEALAYMARHHYQRDRAQKGPYELRRHMREQAQTKPDLMRAWAKSNHDNDVKEIDRKLRIHNFRYSRRIKRLTNRNRKLDTRNTRFVHENRNLVEGGRHWDCLVRFAHLVLHEPEKIKQEFGDDSLVRNGLRNCLDFITPHVPDMARLAELRCASQVEDSEVILFAACLELLRRDGHLNEVPVSHLWVIKANLETYYPGIKYGEKWTLECEVNRLAFCSNDDAEKFCREYIEPQLRDPNCDDPRIDLLSHDRIFHPVAPALAYEWLSGIELMSVPVLDTLFEIVTRHSDQTSLKALVDTKCELAMSFSRPELSPEEKEKRRAFWLMRAIYFLDGTTNPYWGWLTSDKENVLRLNEFSGIMNHYTHPNWPALTSEKVEVILNAFFHQWPKVTLPSNYGTQSPKGETAYRFLTEVIRFINIDELNAAIPVLKRLLDDEQYSDIHSNMKSMLAGLEHKKALRDFKPPSPTEIVEMLDHGAVVTVADLRHLVLQELSNLQGDIDGGEFGTIEAFYAGDTRHGEGKCTRRIAERLSLVLQPLGITVTREHHVNDDKRADFTVAKKLLEKRLLVVTEVKGQWHDKLYEAASEQLNNYYAIHPDAEQQGIYLVIWFGPDEKVAGKKRHHIVSAVELKKRLESNLPCELKNSIDVFVLDVSKKSKGNNL